MTDLQTWVAPTYNGLAACSHLRPPKRGMPPLCATSGKCGT
jgi:hypothetical protein